MIDVQQVLALQSQMVERWHVEPISNPYAGIYELVCQQHQYNYELWHQEDIARSPTASDEEIATVKRAIDRLNQLRNDHIEKVDDWLSDELQKQNVAPDAQARQNTETVGSAIDRLSIMALRLYHYREQLERDDADGEHLVKVRARIAMCETQRNDLGQSLSELIEAILAGRLRHKTYRQMKMYNDPSLNPYLYAVANGS